MNFFPCRLTQITSTSLLSLVLSAINTLKRRDSADGDMRSLPSASSCSFSIRLLWFSLSLSEITPPWSITLVKNSGPSVSMLLAFSYVLLH